MLVRLERMLMWILLVVEGEVAANRTQETDDAAGSDKRRLWEVLKLGKEINERKSAPHKERQLTQLPFQELTNQQLTLEHELLPIHHLLDHPISKLLHTVPIEMKTEHTWSTSAAAPSGSTGSLRVRPSANAIPPSNASSNNVYHQRQLLKSLGITIGKETNRMPLAGTMGHSSPRRSSCYQVYRSVWKPLVAHKDRPGCG